jgi:hypothetical protein
MSDDDEYHASLMEELHKDSRDSYIQRVIEMLEDPDYEGTPIVIDEDSVIWPEGANLVPIIKVLERTKKWFKNMLFDGDK